jgi:hypothetical protein
MSRMFHRVLATSVIGAAALAAPAAAMAADTGASAGGGSAETPTSVVVHLPRHIEAGEPVTVTARIVPHPAAAQGPSGDQPGKSTDGKGKNGKHKHKAKSGQGDGQPGKDDGKDGTEGKGDEPGKEGASGKGHHHKGSGHGKKGKGKRHKGTGRGRRHAVTGKIEFLLDGKAEPSVEVSRDQASEKIQIPLGRHTIVAVYSGDGNFEPAKSTPVAFELTDDPDDQGTQGAQSGDGQGGHVGPITEAAQVDPTVDPQQGEQVDTRDSGDLAPGDQDQGDQGPGADDQDWQDDQD